MSAPNPGEEGVRLWRNESYGGFVSFLTDKPPGYIADNIEPYVALPLAAHEAHEAREAALVERVRVLEEALERAWWNIQNPDVDGVLLSRADEALILAALAAPGGGA